MSRVTQCNICFRDLSDILDMLNPDEVNGMNLAQVIKHTDVQKYGLECCLITLANGTRTLYLHPQQLNSSSSHSSSR